MLKTTLIFMIFLLTLACGTDDSKEEKPETDLVAMKWSQQDYNAFINNCAANSSFYDEGHSGEQVLAYCHCVTGHLARSYEAEVFTSNFQEILDREAFEINACESKYIK